MTDKPDWYFDNQGSTRPEPRVSVVIPAKNEARNLPLVFGGLPEDLYEVILVDGYSTDDTVEVATAAAARRHRHRSDAQGEGQCAGVWIRGGHRRHHRDAGCGRLHRPGRDPPIRRRHRGRCRLRQGLAFHARRGQQRHQPLPSTRQLLPEQDRQRPVQDQLHRPLLRLQRVPAVVSRRDGPRRGRAGRRAAGRDAVGRRLRGRDPDQRPDGHRGTAGDRGAEFRARPAVRGEQPQRLLRRLAGAADHPCRAVTHGDPSVDLPRHRPARRRRSRSGCRRRPKRPADPPGRGAGGRLDVRTPVAPPDIVPSTSGRRPAHCRSDPDALEELAHVRHEPCVGGRPDRTSVAGPAHRRLRGRSRHRTSPSTPFPTGAATCGSRAAPGSSSRSPGETVSSDWSPWLPRRSSSIGGPDRLSVAAMAGAVLLDLDKPLEHFFRWNPFPTVVQRVHSAGYSANRRRRCPRRSSTG